MQNDCMKALSNEWTGPELMSTKLLPTPNVSMYWSLAVLPLYEHNCSRCPIKTHICTRKIPDYYLYTHKAGHSSCVACRAQTSMINPNQQDTYTTSSCAGYGCHSVHSNARLEIYILWLVHIVLVASKPHNVRIVNMWHHTCMVYLCNSAKWHSQIHMIQLNSTAPMMTFLPLLLGKLKSKRMPNSSACHQGICPFQKQTTVAPPQQVWCQMPCQLSRTHPWLHLQPDTFLLKSHNHWEAACLFLACQLASDQSINQNARPAMSKT
jgi:hypothetical protein